MFFERDREAARHRRNAVIAVAPFEALPLDGREGRIARGFLEDVIAELARIPDVEVLAPRTSLSMRSEDLAPARLAETFGVTHLLDSAVRPRADGLAVRANLIETANERLIWSQSYDVAAREAATVLEDIAVEVANHLSLRVRLTRLARVRSRPLSTLAAQDCWLRGLEALRLATPEGDEAARQLFQRALTLDPTYGRAYAGLSLSHFKRWNWRGADEAEREGDRLSLQYAARAEALDDLDPVVQLVLGRTHVYRRDFGAGRRHLERALEISPNHADCLMQAAPLWAYLGEPETALTMCRKAFRLNPLREAWYYFTAFIPFFVNGRLEEGLAILEQAPPHAIFEQSALLAATYALLDRPDAAAGQVPLFLAEFRRAIGGPRATPGEAVACVMDANPFARESDRARLLEGLSRAGLDGGAIRQASPAPPAETAVFALRGGVWDLRFAGRTAAAPDMKGCHDLRLLLSAPRERIHCLELGGRIAESEGAPVMDARARAACQARIRELQEDMAQAERDNDLARSERIGAELDALVDSLAAAVGLRGRSRKLGDPAEKARTAVTWRIRSAIRRIGAVHPELERHLQAAVRTGAFCAYDPETPVAWITS